jgi:hypothetical protein
MATTLIQIFESPLNQWIALLNNAVKSENPAVELYKNGARNILFKLEALCRVHEKVLSNYKYGKWKDRFKSIEDLLGQIDYTDNMLKLFEKKTAFTKTVATKQQDLINTNFETINKLIKEKKWLQNNCKKLSQLLQNKNVAIDNRYQEKLIKFINKEIAETNNFYNDLKGNFTKIEEEVHEIRRKLRWISIYAQCTNGLIQLQKLKPTPEWSTKYAKPEIIKSPFNKLPKPIVGISPINFAYDNFIALSFVINGLGVIKDKGLQLHFLKTDCGFSLAKVKTILGKSAITELQVLQKATTLCKPFFLIKIMETLVIK